MKKILLAPFMGLSAVGLALSIIVHLITLSGNMVPYGRLVWSLHAGIFIVWLPAVVATSQTGLSDFKRIDWWKVVLRGCPDWMKWITIGLFFYAIINFTIFMLSTTILADGAKPTEATVLRGFSGHWMAFYSAAFAIQYSAINIDLVGGGRRCRNGHTVSFTAKFCEQCGAPVIEISHHK